MKILRLCLHFADRFCSEILMLRNDLSTQPAECSGMCGMFRDSLSSPEICNMGSTVEKTNINNVKDTKVVEKR